MNKVLKRQWIFSAVYLLLALAAAYLFQAMFAAPRPRQVSYSDFLQEVRGGRMEEAHITPDRVVGTLKQGAEKNGSRRITATRIPGLDSEPLVHELTERGVKFSGEMQASSWWVGLLAWLVPLGLLFLLYGYGMRRMAQGAGPLNVGRNRAKIYDETSRINVTFADVAGVDEAKAELVEVVDFLRHPQKYQRLGGRIPRGVLLVGPPGTGKTLLARAVAGEAHVPFFSISGSEFVEMFVGVGASRVRDLFEQAKQKAPCIVFIDELDAIGKSRAGARGGDRTRRAGADTQPAPGGDGWFRPLPRRHHHGRHQHAGSAGSRAAAAGALRPAGDRGPSGHARA